MGAGVMVEASPREGPSSPDTSYKCARCRNPGPAYAGSFLHTRFLFPCPLRTLWRGPQPSPPTQADKERTKIPSSSTT